MIKHVIDGTKRQWLWQTVDSHGQDRESSMHGCLLIRKILCFLVFGRFIHSLITLHPSRQRGDFRDLISLVPTLSIRSFHIDLNNILKRSFQFLDPQPTCPSYLNRGSCTIFLPSTPHNNFSCLSISAYAILFLPSTRTSTQHSGIKSRLTE